MENLASAGFEVGEIIDAMPGMLDRPCRFQRGGPGKQRRHRSVYLTRFWHVVRRAATVASRIRELVEKIRPSQVDLPLLDLPEFSKGGWGGFGLPDLALAGSVGITTNWRQSIKMSGIHLTVNGYNVQGDTTV
ncbi:MAG TPA: hypothetical protein H9700_13005 [Candidatus Eisenbergiella intestinipullorum]|nr:hypothetical protein [Candidatus Eisenbergiella intestinipullorum]